MKAPYISFEGRVTQVKRLLRTHPDVTPQLLASTQNLTVNRASVLLRRMWLRGILDRFEYKGRFPRLDTETPQISYRYRLAAKQARTLGMIQGIGLGMMQLDGS